MFVKSVIVNNSREYFSGTLISEKFILISSHLMNQQNNYFYIIDKIGNDCFNSRKAYHIGKVCNDRIKAALRKCFLDIHDYNDNNNNKESAKRMIELFTIHVLSFDRNTKVEELMKIWQTEKIDDSPLKIGNAIVIRSSPFGSRNLINSYSQGIVCNLIEGIILTDCPTVVGCEGGVVMKKKTNNPVGLLVSSFTGWRGECTGLTLAITFDAIFSYPKRKVDYYHSEEESDGEIKPKKLSVIDKVQKSLVYIKSSNSWGTGICLDKTRQLFITNAHVLTNDDDIQVITNNISIKACILFKAVNGQQFDIAILQCDDASGIFHNLRNIEFRNIVSNPLQIGDAVFTLGFPLFPHITEVEPTMTHGHVSLLKKNVILTTCTVLPGLSGGAMCDSNGYLVGVVTCNITNMANGLCNPRINMSIPTFRIEYVLRQFAKQGDLDILNGLLLDDDNKMDWALSKL